MSYRLLIVMDDPVGNALAGMDWSRQPERKSQSRDRCNPRWIPGLQWLRATKLPGNPFIEPPFGLLLAHGAFMLGALDAFFGFLDDVKVILDVFEGAVIGQFIQEGLHFVLGRIHRAYR